MTKAKRHTSLMPTELISSGTRFFLNGFDGFQGIPTVKLIAAGALPVVVTVVLCLMCVLGIHAKLAAVGLGVIGSAWVVAAVVWTKRYIDGHVLKIEKISSGLRRSQNIAKYFESILQDSTDIIFTIDREGLILKFNKGSQHHFGFSQEEVVGKPFKDLFVNEADNRKILDTVLRSGKSANEEVPMKTKEGEIIHLNLSISEMKDEGGGIMGMVVTAKDITEKKKLEMELVRKNELLERLAITDGLTGLYNARHFYEQVKRELSRLKRNPDRVLSLILLDIDHFKDFNDTEGHQMGDHVLRSLGRVIEVCIRKDVDTGYRYGGDEFVILLPDTDQHQARVVAERTQKQFGAFKFGKTSLSIGIAQGKAGEDEIALVKRADEAMYRSKKSGRARITV